MIRWKVVRIDSETREMKSTFSPPGFRKIYRVGKITKANSNTLGIMVFKRKKEALEFINSYNTFNRFRNFKLLKVEVIGRGKTPKKVSVGTTLASYMFKAFYKKKLPSSMLISPLPGTICYPEIKVLSIEKGV